MPYAIITKPNQTKPADLIEKVVREPDLLGKMLDAISDYRIKKLLSRIHEDLKQDWRYETLAKEMDVGVRHVRRLFVTHVGLGLPRYLNDLRLATAKLLLETTTWRLRVIAAEVGFPNERVFLLRFKDKYGELPSEYRNSIAE